MLNKCELALPQATENNEKFSIMIDQTFSFPLDLL